MTIKEAEQIYEWEVERHIEWRKKRAKKAICIRAIIAGIFLALGAFLIIKGINTLPEIYVDYFGNVHEDESYKAILCKLFGSWSLIMGAVFLALLLIAIFDRKKGPKDFTAQNRNLYYNYLKCEDMPQEHKEYYIQKLEEIRNDELVAAIHRGSADASAAILFTTLRR